MPELTCAISGCLQSRTNQMWVFFPPIKWSIKSSCAGCGFILDVIQNSWSLAKSPLLQGESRECGEGTAPRSRMWCSLYMQNRAASTPRTKPWDAAHFNPSWLQQQDGLSCLDCDTKRYFPHLLESCAASGNQSVRFNSTQDIMTKDEVCISCLWPPLQGKT